MIDSSNSSERTTSAPAGLQFDHVEGPPPLPPEALGEAPPPIPQPPSAATLSCQSCARSIADAYYELGGKVVCQDCHDGALAQWNGGTPAGRLLRSLGFGAAAGLLGCLVYYAVLKLTGYEFGLIAILVGYAVGIAVRKGSRGRGGWPYQLLAVALTYLSIVGSQLPLVLEEIGEISPLGFLVLLPILLVMPFLAGFENILGILILGFGLWEAWRLNRGQDWSAAGPFRVAGAIPAAAPGAAAA